MRFLYLDCVAVAVGLAEASTLSQRACWNLRPTSSGQLWASVQGSVAVLDSVGELFRVCVDLVEWFLVLGW